MARSAYLDRGGVTYLWSKFLNKLKTETVTKDDLAEVEELIGEKIVFLEFEDFGKFTQQTYTLPIINIGELKPFTITLTGSNVFGEGKAKLPSGGAYIRSGQYYAGGSILISSNNGTNTYSTYYLRIS